MSATDDLIKQILASSNVSKWTGEGKGSAQANAADMAQLLSDIGITDIKQFGKVPTYAPVEEIGKTYKGERVIQVGDEYGTRNAIKQLDGGTDQDVNATFTYIDVPENAKLEPLYGQLGSGEEQ